MNVGFNETNDIRGVGKEFFYDIILLRWRKKFTTNVLKYTNTDEYSESDVSHINPIDQK